MYLFPQNCATINGRTHTKFKNENCNFGVAENIKIPFLLVEEIDEALLRHRSQHPEGRSHTRLTLKKAHQKAVTLRGQINQHRPVR